MSDAQDAEIVLRYTSATVAQTGHGALGAYGGMPFQAGRGEVLVVRDGRSHPVLLFETTKKDPRRAFVRAFMEAYQRAAAGSGR